MADRARRDGGAPSAPSTDGPLPDGDPDTIVRRSSFSDNPRVGARGQRARQRMLEAALTVFGEQGYHQCGVASITEEAGCSRASFYQYFSSKEDVFRHLAGQVARQLTASAEALDTITPDRAGWESVRAWTDRYAQIYRRYQPVFEVFQIARTSDEALASGAERVVHRHVAALRAKVAATSLTPRQLDAVLEVLLNLTSRSNYLSVVLRDALPGDAPDADRLHTALTDVIHRSLFGLDAEVNVAPPPYAPWPDVPDRNELLAKLVGDLDPVGLTAAGSRTRDMLIEAANAVLVARGYHGTRVDDVTEAAGVSHGAFYRYFDNKDHLVRVVAVRALQRVVETYAAIPDSTQAGSAAFATALHTWLRGYATAHTSAGAMVRVWVEATTTDPALRLESAAALDWGRTRMASFLAPRGFGDDDSEGLLCVMLLDSIGSDQRAPAVIDAAAHIITDGFLGAGARTPVGSR